MHWSTVFPVLHARRPEQIPSIYVDRIAYCGDCSIPVSRACPLEWGLQGHDSLCAIPRGDFHAHMVVLTWPSCHSARALTTVAQLVPRASQEIVDQDMLLIGAAKVKLSPSKDVAMGEAENKVRGSRHHRDMLGGLMSCVGWVGYRRENKEYPVSDWNVSSLPSPHPICQVVSLPRSPTAAVRTDESKHNDGSGNSAEDVFVG